MCNFLSSQAFICRTTQLTIKAKVTMEQLDRSKRQVVMHCQNDESGLKSRIDEIRDLVGDTEDDNIHFGSS